jgi:hypothetical protein
MDQLERKRRARLRAEKISGPEDAEVLALCELYGFGAVMDSAARQWTRRDPVGAFYIGGALGYPRRDHEPR